MVGPAKSPPRINHYHLKLIGNPDQKSAKVVLELQIKADEVMPRKSMLWARLRCKSLTPIVGPSERSKLREHHLVG